MNINRRKSWTTWSPLLLGGLMGCTEVLGVEESMLADAGRSGDAADATDDVTQVDAPNLADRTADGPRDGRGAFDAPPRACLPGTAQVAPATMEDAASTCVTCPAGHYCAGGTDARVSCAEGTWDDDGTSETDCVLRSTCAAGQHVIDPGSATSDRQCADCVNETFTATANVMSCSPWRACPVGSYVAVAPSPVADRECAKCPSGAFGDTTNLAACLPWRNCDPGNYVTQVPSSNFDRVCAKCALGTFSSAPNTTTCVTARAPLAAGGGNTCVLLEDATIKCWGGNGNGQLGLGDINVHGDAAGELGDKLPIVDLGAGRTARSVVAGEQYTCAVLDNGGVKCWGASFGLGSWNPRGDVADEMGDRLPFVDLGAGRVVEALAAGESHTCALLNAGGVKCWGMNSGLLGLGDTLPRGLSPDEMGDNLPTVDLGEGGTAKALVAGSGHTCVLLDSGNVKCWGDNTYGQLGLGDVTRRGVAANQMGNALPIVDLGTGRTALAIAAGSFHTCALLDTARVKCWGQNNLGQLGRGDKVDRGGRPGEMGDALPVVELGLRSVVKAIVASSAHSCVLLDDGLVKCWGSNSFGELGLGDTGHRGNEPDEMGEMLPFVDLGGGRTAKFLALGRDHSCALLDDGNVKCWGRNDTAALGLGDSMDRGDGPGEMGDKLPAVRFR